mgnify:CR=1 FL=1
MSKKNNQENRPKDLLERLESKLDEAYIMAEQHFHKENKPAVPSYASDNLTSDFIAALESAAGKCERASTGYLNIITGLTIKAAYPNIDVRYHQTQIQSQTDKPAGFNFRGVSEHFIYPWMEAHEFHGAKSGWQTRTFERPKPYLLNYDENIGTIKDAFLTIYDLVEKYPDKAIYALSLLMLRRIELRERSKVNLAIPNIQDVIPITRFFEMHFFYLYKDSKGASRLPVLALYAIYSELIKELNRYQGKHLKALEPHSAADARTGSIGDIEVLNADNTPFEAVEVKHQLQITKAIVDSSKQKIRGSRVDRYYILTTSPLHDPAKEIMEEVDNVKKLLGTQMIVNGVIPTIKYYLRLLTNPSSVLPVYVKLLTEDTAIGFEHRDIWNKIATGTIA